MNIKSIINSDILNNLIMVLTTMLSISFLYFTIRNTTFTKRIILYISMYDFTVAFIVAVLGGNKSIVIRLIFIVLSIIPLIVLDKKELLVSVPVSIFTVAIVLCIEYISVFLGSIVLFYSGYRDRNVISTLCSSIIQILITFGFSNIKRIKKAFAYFATPNNFGIGFLLSTYAISFCLLLSFYSEVGMNIGVILFFIIPLILVGLVLWIQSIVKRYYKNKLQDRMDKYTKQEIEDKDKRIERLEAEVTALAKQVHRDNHLMTSVDHSVQELAECDSAEQREKIIGEIHTLYLERNDSMAKEQQKNKILPSTGFALIDSSLSELYVKAAARGIGFDLTVSEEPYYLVNNIISQTDLQTLLCDHIKDAIIAVETAGITNGRILVTIEKNDSIFEITIRDNGVDFEPDTLAKLGKEQETTHADDGGSGIGFMTTFETLQKTKGSLIITEYEQKTPFSKSVAFVFDGLNRFVISTYRKEKLERAIDRDDVRIIVQ